MNNLKAFDTYRFLKAYCLLCFSNVHAVDGDDMTCLHYTSKSKAALAVSVMQAILTAEPNIGTVLHIFMIV